MAIETVGGFNKLLSTNNTKDWVKSASIEGGEQGQDLGADQVLSKNKSFSEMLAESVGEVNNLQLDANKAIERLVSGQTKNTAEVMMAVEKADIAFRTMNTIRSKVIDAYKEVMRMQV